MTLCNLRKSHCVRFWWENQEGARREDKPEAPTLHGHDVNPEEPALPLPNIPTETLLERAARRGALDTWVPVCRVDFNSRVREFFKGETALKIWGAWKGIVYAKEKEAEPREPRRCKSGPKNRRASRAS